MTIETFFLFDFKLIVKISLMLHVPNFKDRLNNLQTLKKKTLKKMFFKVATSRLKVSSEIVLPGFFFIVKKN